jgi:hypothetical protein
VPARISQNLRSGFLHEELGLLLLRQVASVAEVPRPDDVGIDATAVLLRPVADNLRYADGHAFGVQLKAKSVTHIDYDIDDKTKQPKDRGHLRWLKEQRIPLFVGSVDTTNVSIDLYTMQPAYLTLICHKSARGLRVTFGDAEVGSKVDAPTRSLGPPILSFGLDEAQNEQFQRKAYEILKGWLLIEYGNVQTRPAGYIELTECRPNAIPEPQLCTQVNPDWKAIPPEAFNQWCAQLRIIILYLFATADPDELSAVEKVKELLVSSGVDIRPEIIDAISGYPSRRSQSEGND